MSDDQTTAIPGFSKPLEFPSESQVVTLEQRPTQFGPEEAEEQKKAVAIFEAGIPYALTQQIFPSGYSAGTGSDSWTVSGDSAEVGRTVSQRGATAQSSDPHYYDTADMLIPYPKMMLSTGILVCLPCDKSAKVVFQQATQLKNELSATSVEELYDAPTIVQKEFQRHPWYLWVQHDKVEITGDPGKGIWAMGVSSNKTGRPRAPRLAIVLAHDLH